MSYFFYFKNEIVLSDGTHTRFFFFRLSKAKMFPKAWTVVAIVGAAATAAVISVWWYLNRNERTPKQKSEAEIWSFDMCVMCRTKCVRISHFVLLLRSRLFSSCPHTSEPTICYYPSTYTITHFSYFFSTPTISLYSHVQ